MPYLTGDVIPSRTVCRTVRIPDVDWMRQAVNGALLELAEVYNWEKFGDATPQDTADAFWTMWQDYLNSMCTPIGAIMPYAGTTPPDHTLFCDGASLDVATYPALFEVIGYNYGGSGSVFSLPDLRSRVPVGAGSGAGLSTYTLAQTVGEETHQLIVTEMPSHSHFAQPHVHGYSSAQNVEPVVAPGEAPSAVGIPALTDASGVTINNTGGDGPHENRQPSLALNYIIFVD